MPLRFPDNPGSIEWFRHVEQLAEQHHVDIQRLWQVIPQVPYPQAGMPFTGPASPTLFYTPGPVSSTSSSSSGP
jgi:hypothetical protein